MGHILTHAAIPDPDHPKEKAEAIYEASRGSAIFAGWVWPSNTYKVDGTVRQAKGYVAQRPNQSVDDELDHFRPSCLRGDRGTAIARLLGHARIGLEKEAT